MGLLKRGSSEKNSGLLNVINNELPKNSLVVNSALKSSKAMVLPLSKTLDYLLVGFISIVFYNMVKHYAYY
tara:strand:+ start:1080 stop:1292 length:213 start_codon:yes stop_codon:yes gene_type:complete